MIIRPLLPLLHLLLPPVLLAFHPQPPSPSPPPFPPASPQPPLTSSRRDFLSSVSIISPLLCFLFGAPRPSHASSAREAVAKAASKLPGYGAPDTLYPSFFAGDWMETREVVGLVVPPEEVGKVSPEDLAQATAQQGEKLKYLVRFLPYEADGRGPRSEASVEGQISTPLVIADRGFNEEQLWKARLAKAGKSELYQEGVSSRWDRGNPNVLTVSFPDGTVREIKVTKRSFENSAVDAFGSSEYCRVADAAADTGVASVPRLSALRVLRRFKRVGEDIEGLELVKYYPTVSFSADPPSIMTVKARIKMERSR